MERSFKINDDQLIEVRDADKKINHPKANIQLNRTDHGWRLTIEGNESDRFVCKEFRECWNHT